MKRLFITALACASVVTHAYSQHKPKQSVAVNAGLWSNISQITGGNGNFSTQRLLLPSFSVSYDRQYGKLSFGAHADLFSINHELKYNEDTSPWTNKVRPEGRNLVVSLGLSAGYNVIQCGRYTLKASISPRLGYQLSSDFPEFDSHLPRLLETGESYFVTYTERTQQNNRFLPLLKFGLDNELQVGKRGAIMLSVGYQQGFARALTYDYGFIYAVGTPSEKIERVAVQTKASAMAYQLGYRLYL